MNAFIYCGNVVAPNPLKTTLLGLAAHNEFTHKVDNCVAVVAQYKLRFDHYKV